MTRDALQVRSADIDTVWPTILPKIEAALAHDNGRISADDLKARLKADEAMLWLGVEDDAVGMIAVTEVMVWPQMKVLRFVVLAGEDFDGWWAETRPVFVAYAMRKGCKQFEIRGRKGWARKLPDGWDLDHVVMRAEVLDERI